MNFFKKLFKGSTQEVPTSSASILADIEPEILKAQQQLEAFKRTAYLPVTKSHSGRFSIHSKIGGLPYLRHAEDWPTCPNCQKKMALLLQLNGQELPHSSDSQIIQLFYCINEEKECEIELESFFPFSKGVVARRIEKLEAAFTVDYPPEVTLTEHEITKWIAKDDYPHYEEYDQLGLDISSEAMEYLEERNLCVPLEGDKLYGWPYWVQSEEYPVDSETEEKFSPLFQLDSQDRLHHLFGDAGIGHLTQSNRPPHEMTFAWACY